MSAFQSNAFQSNAFQISGGAQAPVDSGVTLLGGGGYVYPYERLREEEYKKKTAQQAELQRVSKELAEAEQRQREIAGKSAQAEARKTARKLAALEASLQEEINALRIERVRLMRRIDDEEAAIALLLSSPFH